MCIRDSPDLCGVGEVWAEVAVEVEACRVCLAIEVLIVGPEVHGGRDAMQRGVALYAGEPQLAVGGLDDREGTRQAAGATGLRFVLEGEEVALGAVLPLSLIH